MDSGPNLWRDWIGRSEQRTDQISLAPLAALAATLDRSDPLPRAGDEVPPLWHWLYFTPSARQSTIGIDGHTRRGEFLPPVPLPRRMWAGGRLQFQHALQAGDEISRHSHIIDVSAKQGRRGALVFVTVRHEISDARGIAVIEEQDLVFREAARADAVAHAVQAAPEDETFKRDIRPDPILLFRYSALTFNGHRIHYDHAYATEVEGYPGLVVHGPLIATLLLDLLRRQHPDADVRRFTFKAVRPLFDLHPFTLCGRRDDEHQVALWSRDHQGALAMLASAELA